MAKHRHPKGEIPDYAAELERCQLPKTRAATYWRHLALALLRLCQDRDPVVARLVGPLAVECAAAQWEFEGVPAGVHRVLLRQFAENLSLDRLRPRLARGKSKPPSVISDRALVDLYDVLRQAIKVLRELEGERRTNEAVRWLVNDAFGLPSPFGNRRERDKLVEQLTNEGPNARALALFRAAARWVGLPPPSQIRLNEMLVEFRAKRAPGKTAKLILHGLTGLAPKTIKNRLEFVQRRA